MRRGKAPGRPRGLPNPPVAEMAYAAHLECVGAKRIPGSSPGRGTRALYQDTIASQIEGGPKEARCQIA